MAGYSTPTQFILDAIMEKANEVFRQQQRLVTTRRDAITLQELLVNPPKPNERMKRAFKRLRQL